MNSLQNDTQYLKLLKEVKQKIQKAQIQALQKVNKSLLQLYWEIGKMIVERQEKAGWGKSIVETLAADLQKAFPGIRGFSAANLWRMRNYYLTFSSDKILATLSREISWSHNIAILEKCKNNQERRFYLEMVKQFGWSYRLLLHEIDNQTNFERTIDGYTKNYRKNSNSISQLRRNLLRN